MKILVVGDLHGNKPKIYFKDFDAIIAPGDFCSDAYRKYIFKALRKRIEDPDSDVGWYDYTGKKKAKKMLDKSLKDGRRIIEFLNSFGKPVYLVLGNWDQTGDKKNKWKIEKQNRYPKLIKGLKNVKDVHFKKKSFNGFDLIGYGIVSGPEYPQYKEDLKRYDKKELKKLKKDFKKKKDRISKLFRKSKNPVIFIPHNVPFNTKLDQIDNKQSPRHGYHYGSVIAKEIVNKHKPLLCIGGHMHEHFGKQKVGKTICINAGFGSKVNTLIDLDEKKGKIKSIKFYPKPYG